MTATYYASDMLASQTQDGSTISYTLDPTLGRIESYTDNGVTENVYYDDSSSNAGGYWTSNSWQRNVIDFNGNLAAEVTSSGTITLELPDMHGDILATATTSPTSTGPTTTSIYTEFGSPESGSTPGNYGWLGADEISSSALGGQMLMGARACNTNTGRFSQVDPVPGGSANAYDYAAQNPVRISSQWRESSVRESSLQSLR